MSNPAVVKRMEKARTFFRTYASRSQPVDLYDRQSWTMAGVHTVITEAFLSVYKQAETVKPEDQEAFGIYALFTIGELHNHHHREEEEYLPRLAPEFQNVIADEHDRFEKPLDDLFAYLLAYTQLEVNPVNEGYLPAKNPPPKPEYDGRKIASTMEQITDDLFTHLEGEIGYLAGDKLRACGLPLSKLQAWEAYESTIVKSLDPTVGLVFFVKHTPSNCQFPALPPGFRSFLVPWVFSRKYKKAWKFAPVQEPLVYA